MATLTKTKSVLAFKSWVGPAAIVFGRSLEERLDGASYLTVTLTPEDWEDMGNPEVITLTIEPGDTLNP